MSGTDERKAIRDGTWVVMNERGVRAERVGRLWTERRVGEWWGEGETAKERRVSRLLDRGCRVLTPAVLVRLLVPTSPSLPSFPTCSPISIRS